MDESTDPNDFSIFMTSVGEMDQFAVGMVDQTNGAITTYMFSMIPNTPIQDGDQLVFDFPRDIQLPQ